MKPKDVFGIVVRTIGLLLMISWVFAVVAALVSQRGTMILNAFLIFAVGGYLLRGAPLLLDWAYSSDGATDRETKSSNKPSMRRPVK